MTTTNRPARTLDADKATEALSALVGHAVRLVTLERSTGSITTVAPVDRDLRRGPLWATYLASPLPTAWQTPEQALVGFAAIAKALVAASLRDQSLDPEKALHDHLATGPRPATELLASLAAAGISKDRADRAARRIGIVRRKAGMAGPWLWALPIEHSKPASLIDRAESTKAEKAAETGTNKEKTA